MRSRQRGIVQQLILPIGMIVAVTLVGAVGYTILEGWSPLDSLYMSVITVSTVGLKEVKSLDRPGQVFTIILVVFGVGAFMYTMSAMANYLITGELEGLLERRRMRNKTRQLSDHYIVCGFGRMGVQVAREFHREGLSFVVVERSPEVAERASESGYLVLEGDSGNDDILREAGVERAKGRVSAIDDDATNIMVVLSARALNEKICIVARTNTEMTESKLISAGANRVLWPYGLGGRRMAQMALRPNVVEFLEVVMHDEELEMWLEEAVVATDSRLDGMEIGSGSLRQETGANIIALRQRTGRLIAAPTPDTKLQAGDILVAIGTRQQLGRLQEWAHT